MAKPKEIRVNVRIAEELKGDVQRVLELTGVDESALVRACLESVVEYFDKHGEITLPLVVLPKSALKKLEAAPLVAGARSRSGASVPDSPSTQFSVNEEPRVVSHLTKTRAALRKMSEKEKSTGGKKS